MDTKFLVLCPFLGTLLAQPRVNPALGSESREMWENGGINATIPSNYRSSVQAPLPRQKHTLQPDYSGGLVHPPAATSHLNCSFHFSFHTILGKMLKGHSKRKGPGLMAPSAMVGTILSPALAVQPLSCLPGPTSLLRVVAQETHLSILLLAARP